MALTDEQRGPRAAWLYHGRGRLFGSGQGGLGKLAEALGERGLYRAPETIKGWEASEARSPIPPEIMPVLEELLGSPAPPAAKPITPEDLLAALAEQTAAITALVAVLAVREGVSPSDLPLAAGELAARLLGERDARAQAQEASRRGGGA